MPRFPIVLVLALAACAPSRRGSAADSGDGILFCVQNAAVGYGNIVARAGMVRMDVLPGQEECRRVPNSGGRIALRAETSAGGAAGRLSYATTLQPGMNSCWRWRLTNQRASSGDLVPCDDTAEPGIY